MLMVLAAGALFATACGIRFSDPDEGNEFFQELEVSGEHAATAPLTAELSYETFYPFEVEISCELYDGKTLVREIGRANAPAVGEGREPEEEDDLVPGNFSFDFSVVRAGTFEVECFTPCDVDNFIVEEFTLDEPRTPAAPDAVATAPAGTPSAEPTRRPCGLP